MKTDDFRGKYIRGTGDTEYLRLIDESFAMLQTSCVLPHLKMLYKSETDMFGEGFLWGNGWWIQNSYGFALGAAPLLDPLWFGKLQNSYDAFWNRIGDGKRIGSDSGVAEPGSMYALCPPDGSLGDAVFPVGIVYRQGDGDFNSYDWFYEAAAAGVVIQTELLLFDRRPEQLKKYIPLLWRSLNFVERTRAENDLFLVGASANLLAPSWGGSYNKETGEIGKAYLTGISVTYSAALIRFIELLRMTGDKAGEEICRARLERNLAALPQLLTEEGYFVKSMDPDGTKHGVYGADEYGYLESVCNVDAIAGGVVSGETAESIYRKLASVPGIRPAGVLCTNYPHLDDTPPCYKNHTKGPDSFGFRSGDWVDGGCWCTVEGRAVLAYLKLGKYRDAYRACRVYMDWAEEYRQDAPLSQWGFNTNNPWQKENDEHTVCQYPVAVMIDNFAAVTCLLRGLFDYRAEAEGLRLTVQMPDTIETYIQSVPVRFGGCEIYLSYRKSENLSAELDGKQLTCSGNEIFIPAERLCAGKRVFLTINGAEPAVPSAKETFPDAAPDGLGEKTASIYAECVSLLKTETEPMRRRMLEEILASCTAAAERRRLPFDRHTLRPMTEDRRTQIIDAYDKTAETLYEGYLRKR